MTFIHADGTVNFDADLQESDFSYSTLTGTLFGNTNLCKANFSNAEDYDINIQNNKIKKAIFSIPEVTSLLKHFDIVIK